MIDPSISTTSPTTDPMLPVTAPRGKQKIPWGLCNYCPLHKLSLPQRDSTRRSSWRPRQPWQPTRVPLSLVLPKSATEVSLKASLLVWIESASIQRGMRLAHLSSDRSAKLEECVPLLLQSLSQALVTRHHHHLGLEVSLDRPDDQHMVHCVATLPTCSQSLDCPPL